MCNSCMQELQHAAKIAGNSKVMHAKIAHVTIALATQTFTEWSCHSTQLNANISKSLNSQMLKSHLFGFRLLAFPFRRMAQVHRQQNQC